jgi:hypothetical protein
MVKYQIEVDDPNAPPERRSKLAIERFFQVSIPLMVFTFAMAALWYQYEKRRRRTSGRSKQLA